MTEIVTNNRKRFRTQSNETSHEQQSKHFINQYVLDKTDQSKMKQIHGKEFTRFTLKVFI